MAITLDGSSGISTANLTSTNGLTVDTNLLFVDYTNNRVGIGTTTPSRTLEVVGNVLVGQGSNGRLGVNHITGTASDFYIGSDNGQSWAGSTSNVPIYFTTNNIERLRIDAAGNLTLAQAARGTITTDNDGSFDMNAASNFKCTPTGNFTLTFTNITSGQSGSILLVNSGGYTVSAAATTKVNSTFLSTVSIAGTYLLSYFTDGTNVYVTNSGAMS